MRFTFIVLLLAGFSVHADPKSNYMIHCMGCHLENGKGMPPDVPEFNNELGLMVSSERGRSYLARVPGAAQSPITDRQLAEVMNWMLDKYSAETLPAGFKPYTADEVAEYRKQVLLNPVAERQALLNAP